MYDIKEIKMKKIHYISVLIYYLLFSYSWLCAQNSQGNIVFDGPHIIYNNDSLIIKYYNSGVVSTYKVEQNIKTKFQGFSKDSTITYTIPNQFLIQKDKYPDTEKLFVVSDIHGQYNIFKKLLQNSGIIDNNNNWIWGNGHLVVLGDVFDRGDMVHESLWLLYNLEQQAADVGGVIHFLLGNHEVMVIQNDLRYVHNNYITIADSFSVTVPNMYGINTFWGRWLRSKNFLTQIGSILFVHGGIHPELASLYDSITEINNIMIENIDTPRETIKENPALSLLFRGSGPIWYRGFFTPDSMPDVSDKELTDIMKHFSVEKIIVGHTTADHLYTSHNNRILCVDGGIKEGIRGEGLLIQNGTYYIVDTNGRLDLIFK